MKYQKLFFIFILFSLPLSAIHDDGLLQIESLKQAISTGEMIHHRHHLIYFAKESDQGQDLNGDGDTGDHVVQVHDLRRDLTSNLGVAAANIFEGGLQGHQQWVAFRASESHQFRDMNQDGDFDDEVMHLHNLKSGQTLNLGLACGEWFAFYKNNLMLMVDEADHARQDLNGDGDSRDMVMFDYDLETQKDKNLKLAVFPTTTPGAFFADQFYFLADERDQREDLNQDGDQSDYVLSSYDFSQGKTFNLEYAVSVSWPELITTSIGLFFAVSENDQGQQDLNQDFDDQDRVLHYLPHGPDQPAQHRADNLSLALHSMRREGDIVALFVFEDSQSQDLNGDQDVRDMVLVIIDAQRERIFNTACAMQAIFESLLITENEVYFRVSEQAQGKSKLNGDRDKTDHVLHVWRRWGDPLTNLGIAGRPIVQSRSGKFFFTIDENQEGQQDFNFDGDSGDDVLHVMDTATMNTQNLELALVKSTMVITQGIAAGTFSENDQAGVDRNQDGDAFDHILFLYHLARNQIWISETATNRLNPKATRSGVIGLGVDESTIDDRNYDGDKDDLVMSKVQLEAFDN